MGSLVNDVCILVAMGGHSSKVTAHKPVVTDFLDYDSDLLPHSTIVVLLMCWWCTISVKEDKSEATSIATHTNTPWGEEYVYVCLQAWANTASHDNFVYMYNEVVLYSLKFQTWVNTWPLHTMTVLCTSAMR